MFAGEYSFCQLKRAGGAVSILFQYGHSIGEIASLSRRKLARNSIKHLNDTNDAEVTLDLEGEAIGMLNRAVHNVILLQLPYTDEIRRFDDWYLESCVGV